MSAATRTVIVVGGGLAGLSAAWKLSRAGCAVTVLERLQCGGGRAGGERVEGFCIDRSLPLVSTGDRHLLSWVAELGIADRLLPLRLVQHAQFDRGKTVPIHGQSPLAVAKLPGVRWWQGIRTLRLSRLMRRYRAQLDVEYPEKAAGLDYRSVADFATLYFGASVRDHWVAPAAMSLAAGDIHEMSRVAFLLQLEEQQRGALALPRAGLLEVARAAVDRLPMRYGFEVARVEPREAGGFHVHCRRDQLADETLEADAVLFASTATNIREIASACLVLPEQDFFRQVHYEAGATLSIALSRPPAGVPEHVRVAPGQSSSIESILLEPGAPGERVPTGSGLAVVTARGDFASQRAHAPDDVVTKELLDAHQVVSSRRSPAVRFVRLHRSGSARPRFDVGAYRNLARFQDVQGDRRAGGRRLYFAGDYLIGSRPEHAVISGARAARSLLSDWA